MPSTLSPLAVTGATGAVGGRVARILAAEGVGQRLLVRSPVRAPQLAGAAVLTASYADSWAVRHSLDGVRTLFMVSAAESSDRLAQHRSVISAAAAAGVEHIVYTSFLAAAPDSTFTLARDHVATETMIRETGLAWTFLRDSFYMDILRDFVGEDHVLRGPAGSGRCAFVARDDVARVAATVLRAPAAHAGRSYDLTGPQALSLQEVAATLSTALRQPVTFHDESVEEAYASRRRWEAPQWQYDAWVSTYTAIASGELALVSDDVRAVTGRSPLTFAQHLAAEETSTTPGGPEAIGEMMGHRDLPSPPP